MNNQSKTRMRGEQGFSLVELIGVLAVIGVLVAMVLPSVFNTISDAKVKAFAQEIKTYQGAMTKFFADTGRFPHHIPSDTGAIYHQLMRNPTGTSAIKGWDGPYIEKEFEHPFNKTAYHRIWSTTGKAQQFDLDGDGTKESGNTSYIRIDSLTADQAESLSNAIDKDGGVTTGTKAWWLSGQVKTYGDRAVTGNNIILIYLGKA